MQEKPKTTKKTSSRTGSTTSGKLAEWVHRFLDWVDVNLLPIICLPILMGLAAYGVASFLSLHQLTSGVQWTIAVIVAAILGVKAHK